MFVSVLNQQAKKTVPKINKIIEKIHNSLENTQTMNNLQDEKQFLEKALSCYESDIHRAEDTGHEYFIRLVGDMIQARKDLKTIKIALEKINDYSE